MTSFEIIAEVEDLSVARVLITALKAHGFHPHEGGEGGLPGVRGFRGLTPIEVPDNEAEDARALANDLIAEMTRGKN